MRRSLFGAAFAFAAAVFFATGVQAALEIPLEGTFNFKGAQGTAVIEEGDDTLYEQEQVTIYVDGLKPNSVYSAWLSKDEPGNELRGLGVKPYSFVTDGNGGGTFVAAVGEGEFHRWDIFEIAYHPNGDPNDLQSSQVALRGEFGGIFD